MLHITNNRSKSSDKTQLITNIATVYYQLLSVDAQIKVAEETLINRDQSVETIRALKSRICY
jgi:outer membrane protein TolC